MSDPGAIQPTPSHWGVITASDIETEQKRVLAQAQADDAAFQACTSIDVRTKATWAAFYSSLVEWCNKTVYNIAFDPRLWTDSNGILAGADAGERMMAYEAQLAAWERRLMPLCPQAPPSFIQLADSTPSVNAAQTIVKWLAIGAVAIAGAYVVSQVVPPIVHLLPDRRSPSPKANPLHSGRGPRRSKKALIAKATRARFDMADGRHISCGGTMMHDPSGRYWPKASCLIGPFKPGLDPVSDDAFWGAPRDYLGRGYKARYGTVDLPPRSIRAWAYVGDVSRGEPEDGEIQYVRRGIRARGAFYHPFNRRSLYLITHGRGRVRLYRFGSFYRLELPRRSIVDDRGFVWP